MKTTAPMTLNKQLIFLRDVTFLKYTFTAFGGPGAYSCFASVEFVEKRRLITEEEQWSLTPWLNYFPGPSSTQTLVGIAWKVGGLQLAIISS